MEKYIKELAIKIATDLIAMEDLKEDTRRPKGQTLYYSETKQIMDELKDQVLLQMGYNNNED